MRDYLYRFFEQAFKRQEVESKVTRELKPLTEHLIKMLKWEDSINNPKHMKNIRRIWTDRILDYVLSSTTKFKKNQLHRIICQEPLRKSQYYIDALRIDYDREFRGSLKSYRTDEEVKELLDQILSKYALNIFEAQSNLRVNVNLESIITEDLQIYIYGLNK